MVFIHLGQTMGRADNCPPSFSECCGTPAPTWTVLCRLMATVIAPAIMTPMSAMAVVAIIVTVRLIMAAVTVSSPVAAWMIHPALDVDGTSIRSIIRLDVDGTWIRPIIWLNIDGTRGRCIVWLRVDDAGDNPYTQSNRRTSGDCAHFVLESVLEFVLRVSGGNHQRAHHNHQDQGSYHFPHCPILLF